MNISHYTVDSNTAILVTNYCNSLNSCKLPKSHISRISDGNHSSSEFHHVQTITVLISFLKLSKYDDTWLKLGKQLLLLKKSPNKYKFYKAALSCFKSSIKKHHDNYIPYYFSGLTLCLLGRYAEALRMFDLSLRKNTEESTALLHTLSEMLSITEGIKLVTGNSDVGGTGNSDASMQHGSSPNNRDFTFNHSLDKLEQKIINKLQRHKIDGAAGNNMTKDQEQWNKYFKLGMYWYGREHGNHKSLMYFRRCLQLNPKNETSNYYVGRIQQNQGRYHESLEGYKRAISLRPDEGFYYYMASQVYTALEESKEAIEMIDKAIVLSPRYSV